MTITHLCIFGSSEMYCVIMKSIIKIGLCVFHIPWKPLPVYL